MRRLVYIILFGAAAVFCLPAQAQSDTTGKHKIRIEFSSDSNLVFTGTRISEKETEDEHAKLELGGYVSSYYAHYSDETTVDGFVQFPTMAPKNNQFGLNMVALSFSYLSTKVRSKIILHYGDIPKSVWSDSYNMIQEAYAGARICKKLWFDAGFFKTHIGLESIQPRENVTSSMAVATYYDPYYLCGAKLTYEVSPRLSLQLNAFDGYNGFVDNNKNKAYGFSAIYDVNDRISITYNLLTSDETPDPIKTTHQRIYQDLYASFKFKRLSLGAEINYGLQRHTLERDTARTAYMASGLIVAQYQLIKLLAIYGRAEYFSDPDQILTGKQLSLGRYLYGGTLGFELTLYKNVSFSAESRYLLCDRSIFRQGSTYGNTRYEIIGCFDIWF
jgi:hypothetical protein